MTAGEFFELHDIMVKLEGSARQGITEQAVWELFLICEEADAYGLAVSDAEVDDALRKDQPDVYEGVLSRWKAVWGFRRERTPPHRTADESRQAPQLPPQHDAGDNSRRL